MRSPSPFAAGSPAHTTGQDIKRQFLAWRRSAPSGFRRIPDNLWNAATKLAVATTVHQVSRFLGLDYSLLKKRVIAVAGATCSALPGRSKRKVEKEDVSVFRPSSRLEKPQGKRNPVDRSSSSERRSPVIRDDLINTLTPMTRSSQPLNGFVEAIPATVQPLVGQPLLAEIRSSTGALLRLFSPDTIPIVRAFLQP